MKNKVHFISLIVLLFFNKNIYSKGDQGFYLFCGSIKINGTTQTNYEFSINGQTIKTDDLGNYSYQMNWITYCPSNISFIKRRKWLRNNNPRYIIVVINKQEFRVRNKWKKYGVRQRWKSSKEKMIKNFDV